MTTVMILYAIGYGLNIISLVLVGTKTLPMPEKCSHGHPVKENGCIKVRAERRAARKRQGMNSGFAHVRENVPQHEKARSRDQAAKILGTSQATVQVWDE